MASLDYSKYTELLSRRIHGTLDATQKKQIAAFEAAQLKTCPDCGTSVTSEFTPPDIAHDVTNCPFKKKPKD